VNRCAASGDAAMARYAVRRALLTRPHREGVAHPDVADRDAYILPAHPEGHALAGRQCNGGVPYSPAGLSQPETNHRTAPVAGSYNRRLMVPMLPP
jgi:hypothetical protein